MRKQGWMLLTACLVLLAFPTRKAKAQFGGGVFVCANCSDEGTTLVMKAQQVLQYLKEAQTALAAIQSAQMMVREGINLAEHPSTNIMTDLSMLSTILVQSQGLAGNMAQLNAQFQNTYAPYNSSPLTNYALAYNNWASTTLKTINGSLNAAGYQGGMLQQEGLWMQQVQAMNRTSMGQDSLLQLGNTIGTQEVAQLQSLRQLMISNMQANAAVTAQEVNTQQAQQSAQQNSFTHANWSADPRLF